MYIELSIPEFKPIRALIKAHIIQQPNQLKDSKSCASWLAVSSINFILLYFVSQIKYRFGNEDE